MKISGGPILSVYNIYLGRMSYYLSIRIGPSDAAPVQVYSLRYVHNMLILSSLKIDCNTCEFLRIKQMETEATRKLKSH